MNSVSFLPQGPSPFLLLPPETSQHIISLLDRAAKSRFACTESVNYANVKASRVHAVCSDLSKLGKDIIKHLNDLMPKTKDQEEINKIKQAITDIQQALDKTKVRYDQNLFDVFKSFNETRYAIMKALFSLNGHSRMYLYSNFLPQNKEITLDFVPQNKEIILDRIISFFVYLKDISLARDPSVLEHVKSEIKNHFLTPNESKNRLFYALDLLELLSLIGNPIIEKQLQAFILEWLIKQDFELTYSLVAELPADVMYDSLRSKLIETLLTKDDVARAKLVAEKCTLGEKGRDARVYIAEHLINKNAIYQTRSQTLNLDSARQSPIEAKRSERGDPSLHGKGDEEDQLGKVAASPNSKFETASGIDEAIQLSTEWGINADLFASLVGPSSHRTATEIFTITDKMPVTEKLDEFRHNFFIFLVKEKLETALLLIPKITNSHSQLQYEMKIVAAGWLVQNGDIPKALELVTSLPADQKFVGRNPFMATLFRGSIIDRGICRDYAAALCFASSLSRDSVSMEFYNLIQPGVVLDEVNRRIAIKLQENDVEIVGTLAETIATSHIKANVANDLYQL